MGFQVGLVIPDLWQQEGSAPLQQGKDVWCRRRQDRGKTYIFELLFRT